MNAFCRQIVLVCGAVCGLSLLGCDSHQRGAPLGVSPSTRDTKVELPSGDPTQIDARFEARLREITTEYTQFSLLIGGVRFAPELCSALATPMSTTALGTPHGQKLYWLFVKDADAYSHASEREQPVGQTIVKESWISEEVKDVHATWDVERGGKKYRAGRQAELFIMFKEESETDGTDNGWVYGIVTPDGQRVTSAGRVAACMKCHQNAKPDRLFGAKSATAAAED